MSVRDGQRLGVLDSVSVTVKCLVSHIHGEVCRLGYRFAGSHAERSVIALFSSRSKKRPENPTIRTFSIKVLYGVFSCLTDKRRTNSPPAMRPTLHLREV